MQSGLIYFSALAFPGIDPIAFSLGPVNIHWYGIGYVVSITLGWLYARRLLANASLWRNGEAPMTAAQLDDFILYATIGIVLGGRIGYELFYDVDFFSDPLRFFQVYDGGMSFHGGFLGTTIAMIWFARANRIAIWSLFDLTATVVPIGLGIVRVANFINGELWGKKSDVWWAVSGFPNTDGEPRHPSQLYEAGLEGIVLLSVLAFFVFRRKSFQSPGLTTGIFVCGYAASRIAVEFVREPDAQLGYLFGGWLTMGMLLSLPMLAAGIWAIVRARRAQ